MPKGFLQIDARRLAELLEVFGVDYEAMRVYMWLLALAHEGALEGKERTLAARAGFASVAQLRFVLNRLALMRLHGAVLVSFDNGPNGISIIRVKELPDIVIRRGGSSAHPVEAPRPAPAPKPAPDAAQETASPTVEVLSAPVERPVSARKLSAAAQMAQEASIMEANLTELSSAAADQMRLWLDNLAFCEPAGKLDPRTARTIWTTAMQIITGFDERGINGEQILIEAIQAASAKSDLTAEGAARYLLSCAKHGFSDAQGRTSGSRPGARVDPAQAGSATATPLDDLRVHTSHSSDDF
jgi:hypothetical protein